MTKLHLKSDFSYSVKRSYTLHYGRNDCRFHFSQNASPIIIIIAGIAIRNQGTPIPDTGGVGVGCPGASVYVGSPGLSVGVGCPGARVLVGCPGADVYVGSPGRRVAIGCPGASVDVGCAAI